MFDLVGTPGSYLGIIAILVLTGCGLPIPEEVVVVAAGVLAAQGHLEPVQAFIVCLFGAIMGDCVMYFIGYRWGHGLLKEHPRFAHLLHAEREKKYEEMIRRHGLKVLLASRFMVGVRSPIYLSAGILRIPFRRFLLMDLLCASIVVGLFFTISYVFGEQIVRQIRNAEITFTIVILVIAAIGVAVYFWRRRKRRLCDARSAAQQVDKLKPPGDRQPTEPVGRTRER